MNKNNKLFITEQQKIMCERYGVLPQKPEEMVAIALDNLNGNPIYGTRIKQSEGNTVSWFFLLRGILCKGRFLSIIACRTFGRSAT